MLRQKECELSVRKKKKKKERKKPRGTTFIAFACGAFVLQPLSCLHGHYLVEGLGTEISFAPGRDVVFH